MIDATVLFKDMDLFSPWFPRQADMLRVTAECIAALGAELTIELYTKNSEDTGNGNPVDEAVTIVLNTLGQRETVEWKTVVSQEGVQQLLRFRYSVTGNEDYEWILFRLLPAVWFDALAAS